MRFCKENMNGYFTFYGEAIPADIREQAPRNGDDVESVTFPGPGVAHHACPRMFWDYPDKPMVELAQVQILVEVLGSKADPWHYYPWCVWTFHS